MKCRPLVAASVAVVAVGSLSATAVPAHAAPVVTNLSLQIGATDSQRTVTWLGAAGTADYVQIAQKTGNAWHKAATVRPYEQGAADNRPGLEFNHVRLDGLKTNTTYLYRVCVAANDCGATQEFSTDTKGNFNFLVYGDPQLYVGGKNPGAGWAQTLATSTSMFPDSAFLFTMGDQVDSTTMSKSVAEWDLFFAPEQMRSYALAAAVGNHDNAGGKGVQYGQNIAQPATTSTLGTTAPGTGDYSFVHNGVLFMVLNTNNGDLAQHEQFLRESLAANPDAKWNVVQFHQAPFSAASHVNDGDVVKWRTQLAPILSELNIDLVLNGHDHDYARSYLMNGSTPVAGTGGAKVAARPGEVLYIETNSASGGKFYGLTGDYPWAAVVNQEQVPNFTNVTVQGNSLQVVTYRGDGSVVDDVTLTQAHGHK